MSIHRNFSRGGTSKFPYLFQVSDDTIKWTGSEFFQIRESDSCSDSSCNHRSNSNLPMFSLYKWTHCYCRNWKVTPDPGPVFPKLLTPGPIPGPNEKRRIRPESISVIRIRSHLWYSQIYIWNANTLNTLQQKHPHAPDDLKIPPRC